MGPELPTTEEQKAIDAMIETNIDFTIEQRHREVLKCMVCEAGELDDESYCTECGAKTDF
jgi:hypothetical protein